MTNRTKKSKRCRSRLERIERKCDRILAELLILRQRIASRPDIDVAIDRLHKAARNMKGQCERERDAVRHFFNSPKSGL